MDRKGYTLIEVLIAAAILVIVISLATLMFVKAEKMNQIIRYESSVSNVVDGMLNEIIYGNNSLNIQGLSNANSFSYIPSPSPSLSPYYLVYSTPSSPAQSYYYAIAPGLNSGQPPPPFPTLYTGTGTDTTLWQSTNGSNWTSLDFNKKIILQPGSGFQYYNCYNNLLNGLVLSDSAPYDTATYVQIILRAGSNDPALSKMLPQNYETSVRIKNKPSF
ncbi:MAG: prepilin-type N-terminal cleavage/methylation domain-containing protein [Candidatus Omnitrophica bacterium]|nr:prepilin-type N-terminal cleavage/methylation domain-containing protein [Candidatus Omnitrophota bacterium]